MTDTITVRREDWQRLAAREAALTALVLRLAEALNEIRTNGRWTEGEQNGEWQINGDVYDLMRAALTGPLLAEIRGRG